LIPRELQDNILEQWRIVGYSHVYQNSVACASKIFPLKNTSVYDISKELEKTWSTEVELLK
jgi:hypothetical protein